MNQSYHLQNYDHVIPQYNPAEQEPPVYNLYIKPTYAVLLRQRNKTHIKKSIDQLKAEKNLKDNRVKGVLSKSSITKLKNAVNWLSAAAPVKYVYHKETNQRYKFKLNFITLTLPTTEHTISDNYFKKTLLHNFINTARYKFGLKSYIWKVETQANGNIHAHMTTDTFIHHADLRSCWNKILIKHGIMKPYTDKHSKMTFQEYNQTYNSEGKKDIFVIQKAYADGVNSNWSNPNSTDVKAVHKVKDIAAYLAKYLSKNEEDRRKITGRIWGCSYNISNANKLSVEITPGKNESFLRELFQKEIDWKPIEIKDKLTGAMRKIGELYLYELADWGKKIKGELLQLFNEHLFFIKNDIDVLGLKSFADVFSPGSDDNLKLKEVTVENSDFYGDFSPNPRQLSCPF
jgi:hypothetical protein